MAFASTAPMPAAVYGRRVCAVLAAVSAGLHGMMATQAQSLFGAGVIVAMMAVCLYCARDLWLSGSLRSWCVVAVMNLAMVAVHWSVPGCHPSAGTVTSTPASTLMMTASTLAVTEAVIATAVLFYRTRDRAALLGRQAPPNAWVG